jgi:hypothetical protein
MRWCLGLESRRVGWGGMGPVEKGEVGGIEVSGAMTLPVRSDEGSHFHPG